MCIVCGKLTVPEVCHDLRCLTIDKVRKQAPDVPCTRVLEHGQTIVHTSALYVYGIQHKNHNLPFYIGYGRKGRVNPSGSRNRYFRNVRDACGNNIQRIVYNFCYSKTAALEQEQQMIEAFTAKGAMLTNVEHAEVNVKDLFYNEDKADEQWVWRRYKELLKHSYKVEIMERANKKYGVDETVAEVTTELMQRIVEANSKQMPTLE